MPVLRQATRTRLTLARDISCALELDPLILAVIATGSVARNRCSRSSDLDLTVITGCQGIRRSITSEIRQGVTIDIEWLTKRRALLMMKGGKRDLKGLREASRLGLGVFLLDRDSLESNFRILAVNLLPDRAIIEKRMVAVSTILKDLSSKRSQQKEIHWELCRALVDNLAFVLLMLHPFRYHKPKWIMVDLRDAGYDSLIGLLRKAYRIGSNSSNASGRSIELSRRFIEEMGRLMKTPSIEHMLKSGFTRKYAAWSYICRTWEDAKNLFQDRKYVEGNFTAKFAARMTFPLYLERFKPDYHSSNPLVILKKIGDDRLSEIYQQLFPVPATKSHADQAMVRGSQHFAEICWNLKQEAYGEFR